MAYQQILFERSEGVGTVTLNRPDQLNAFTPKMLEELLDVLKGMERDPEVRVIVITGAGKAFCAGEDFKSRAIAEVPDAMPNDNAASSLPASTVGGSYSPEYSASSGSYQPAPTYSPRNPGPAPVEINSSGYSPVFTNNAPVAPSVNAPNLPAMTEQVQRAYNPLIRQLRHIEKPVIAAVNGTAAGFGLGLALACDIRYASDRARFMEVAVRVGLIPGAGNGFFLPRLIGLSKAMELAFTGDELNASEAEKLGLISKVFPADQLLTQVRTMAVRMAKGPTRAIGLAKTLIYSNATMNLSQALELETQLMDEVAHTEDYKEGLTAFVQKRAPQYKGR